MKKYVYIIVIIIYYSNNNYSNNNRNVFLKIKFFTIQVNLYYTQYYKFKVILPFLA